MCIVADCFCHFFSRVNIFWIETGRCLFMHAAPILLARSRHWRSPWRKFDCLVHCISKWVYVSLWRVLQDSLDVVSLIGRVHRIDFVVLDLQSDTIFIFGAYDIAPLFVAVVSL